MPFDGSIWAPAHVSVTVPPRRYCGAESGRVMSWHVMPDNWRGLSICHDCLHQWAIDEDRDRGGVLGFLFKGV